MIIKTKKDAQLILDCMKNDNLVIEYTKEKTSYKIYYDEELNIFRQITNNGWITGNGKYPECTAMHLIFIDRKYINEQCNLD